MKTVSGTNMQLRQINSDKILAALRGSGDASVAELARETGLSVATCASVVAEMAADGRALELEERKTGGGRPARRFRHNPDHSLVAIVHFRTVGGREIMSCRVVNTAGEVKSSREKGKKALSLEDVDEALRDSLEMHPSVNLVVFSVPGVLHNGLVRSCDVPALVGKNLEERAASLFGRKAVAENDMNLAATGYCSTHPGASGDGLAYVNFPVDKCIGAGLVVNGWLVRGKSHFAGELGSLPRPAGDAGRKGRKQTMAGICQALVAVLNPGVIVLCGELVEEGMRDGIAALLSRSIPGEHMPALDIKENFDDDCFAGALAIGVRDLGGAVRLVEKEREWCIDV